MEELGQKIRQEIGEIIKRSEESEAQADFERLATLLELRHIFLHFEGTKLIDYLNRKKLFTYSDFATWKMYLWEEAKFPEEEIQEMFPGIIQATIFERLKEKHVIKEGRK